VDLITLSWAQDLIAAYGLWVLFVVVMLESAGVPMPGETTLVAAALYAGSSHQIEIASVIIVAAGAAIIGDNFGYFIGRSVGVPLIVKYGRYVRLNKERMKVGQYLFLKHGGKIVFFGRFIAILRTYAAVLAGVNLMPWRNFLLLNALGGACWATVFGVGAYVTGRQFERIAAMVTLPLLIGAVICAILGVYFVRRHERKLMAEADRALSGSWPHIVPRPTKQT
jgi:membrane protein DedA with SNARE-associated domain